MKIGKLNVGRRTVIIVLALVALLLAVVSPYCLLGAPDDAFVHIRKGANIESVRDSIQMNLDVKFGNRVHSMLKLLQTDLATSQGAYKIKKGESALSVARRIARGQQDGVRFTFNNVRTLDEWAQRWGSKFMEGPVAMRQALHDSATCALYGKTPVTIACLLLPDTYEFYWNITPEKTLKRMQEYYDKFWTQSRKDKAAKLALSPDQVTILASIVEEETSKDDELGKVARLYLNRLKDGMRLQADPTVKFAIGDFSIKRITEAMTQVESPYNTYRVQGLPPGPIRLPEKATIDAVLDAPQHDYIYMCAKEDFSGYHNFTNNYEEHLANARRYQWALNANGIK